MRKIVLFLLSFVLTVYTIGIDSLSARYANNSATFAQDSSESEEDDLQWAQEALSFYGFDCHNLTYGTSGELTIEATCEATAGEILGYGGEEELELVNIEAYFDGEVLTLTLVCEDLCYEEEITVEPEYDGDGKYDGSAFIDGEECNIFDLCGEMSKEADEAEASNSEEEETEEEIYTEDGDLVIEEPCPFGDSEEIEERGMAQRAKLLMGASSFPLTESKKNNATGTRGISVLSLFAVVAIVALTVACISLVNSLSGVGHTVGDMTPVGDMDDVITTLRIGSRIVKMIKWVATTLSRIETQRNENDDDDDDDLYYIAIPIINKNVAEYSGCDIAVGDMLISEYPVDYDTAKRSLREGSSIYTYDQQDAYDVLKNAWKGTIPIPHPAEKKNYFNHYHPFYWVGSVKKERYAYINNERVSIHSFYGEPKAGEESNG